MNEVIRVFLLRSVVLFLFMLVSAAAQATIPLTPDPLDTDNPSQHQLPEPQRDTLYCQNPDYDAVYQMSTGFDSEIADDIPPELAGHTIHAVTFWVGEWYGAWQDPNGININFYQESCPPELAVHLGYFIPWHQLETEHVHSGLATVYRVTASLPFGLVVTEGMSIGGQAVIDWGHDEPFCGLCATHEWDIAGCGEAYLDATWWGYDRWTSIAHYTQIPRDFAYCLVGPSVAAPAADQVISPALESWPNPFNPRTTIHFTLPAAQPAQLHVVDAAGRRVAQLCDELLTAGDHARTWNGTHQHGRKVPAGLYFAVLETGGARHAFKLVMVK